MTRNEVFAHNQETDIDNRRVLPAPTENYQEFKCLLRNFQTSAQQIKKTDPKVIFFFFNTFI